jgi:hypothetical protein
MARQKTSPRATHPSPAAHMISNLISKFSSRARDLLFQSSIYLHALFFFLLSSPSLLLSSSPSPICTTPSILFIFFFFFFFLLPFLFFSPSPFPSPLSDLHAQLPLSFFFLLIFFYLFLPFLSAVPASSVFFYFFFLLFLLFFSPSDPLSSLRSACPAPFFFCYIVDNSKLASVKKVWLLWVFCFALFFLCKFWNSICDILLSLLQIL